MGKFDPFDFSPQKQIFTDEERKELWIVLKQAGAGKLSEQATKDYVEALNKAIEDAEK